jgi:DNA-binding NarL/FixJ family response regulator
MLTKLEAAQGAQSDSETWKTGESPGMSIRVLFVEDDPLCSNAFKRALGLFGVECVVADTVSAARQTLHDLGDSFDAVLLDLRLPDGRGEELLPAIEALPRQPGIVIFSDFLNQLHPEATSFRAILLTKQIAPSLLARILRLAARGYAQTTLERFAKQFCLTSREADILNRVAGGTNPKQIALDMDCSIQAVYAHLARIGKKTDCGGYQEVIAKLFRFSCHALGHPDWAA